MRIGPPVFSPPIDLRQGRVGWSFGPDQFPLCGCGHANINRNDGLSPKSQRKRGLAHRDALGNSVRP